MKVNNIVPEAHIDVQGLFNETRDHVDEFDMVQLESSLLGESSNANRDSILKSILKAPTRLYDRISHNRQVAVANKKNIDAILNNYSRALSLNDGESLISGKFYTGYSDKIKITTIGTKDIDYITGSANEIMKADTPEKRARLLSNAHVGKDFKSRVQYTMVNVFLSNPSTSGVKTNSNELSDSKLAEIFRKEYFGTEKNFELDMNNLFQNIWTINEYMAYISDYSYVQAYKKIDDTINRLHAFVSSVNDDEMPVVRHILDVIEFEIEMAIRCINVQSRTLTSYVNESYATLRKVLKDKNIKNDSIILPEISLKETVEETFNLSALSEAVWGLHSYNQPINESGEIDAGDMEISDAMSDIDDAVESELIECFRALSRGEDNTHLLETSSFRHHSPEITLLYESVSLLPEQTKVLEKLKKDLQNTKDPKEAAEIIKKINKNAGVIDRIVSKMSVAVQYEWVKLLIYIAGIAIVVASGYALSTAVEVVTLSPVLTQVTAFMTGFIMTMGGIMLLRKINNDMAKKSANSTVVMGNVKKIDDVIARLNKTIDKNEKFINNPQVNPDFQDSLREFNTSLKQRIAFLEKNKKAIEKSVLNENTVQNMTDEEAFDFTGDNVGEVITQDPGEYENNVPVDVQNEAVYIMECIIANREYRPSLNESALSGDSRLLIETVTDLDVQSKALRKLASDLKGEKDEGKIKRILSSIERGIKTLGRLVEKAGIALKSRFFITAVGLVSIIISACAGWVMGNAIGAQIVAGTNPSAFLIAIGVILSTIVIVEGTFLTGNVIRGKGVSKRTMTKTYGTSAQVNEMITAYERGIRYIDHMTAQLEAEKHMYPLPSYTAIIKKNAVIRKNYEERIAFLKKNLAIVQAHEKTLKESADVIGVDASTSVSHQEFEAEHATDMGKYAGNIITKLMNELPKRPHIKSLHISTVVNPIDYSGNVASIELATISPIVQFNCNEEDAYNHPELETHINEIKEMVKLVCTGSVLDNTRFMTVVDSSSIKLVSVFSIISLPMQETSLVAYVAANDPELFAECAQDIIMIESVDKALMQDVDKGELQLSPEGDIVGGEDENTNDQAEVVNESTNLEKSKIQIEWEEFKKAPWTYIKNLFKRITNFVTKIKDKIMATKVMRKLRGMVDKIIRRVELMLGITRASKHVKEVEKAAITMGTPADDAREMANNALALSKLQDLYTREVKSGRREADDELQALLWGAESIGHTADKLYDDYKDKILDVNQESAELQQVGDYDPLVEEFLSFMDDDDDTPSDDDMLEEFSTANW